MPRLTFFPQFQPDWKIESLYTKWYKPGRCDDLWFRWQGKPLLLAPRADPAKLKDPALAPEIADTSPGGRLGRCSTRRRTRQNGASCASTHPARQRPDGKVEQLAISKSMGGPLWKIMDTGG